MVDFRAQLGIPQGLNDFQLSNIVTLGKDTSAIQFDMFCSQFMVVQLDPGSAYMSPSWTVSSQPADSPWVFASTVQRGLAIVYCC
jgi:hypothetical protein